MLHNVTAASSPQTVRNVCMQMKKKNPHSLCYWYVNFTSCNIWKWSIWIWSASLRPKPQKHWFFFLNKTQNTCRCFCKVPHIKWICTLFMLTTELFYFEMILICFDYCLLCWVRLQKCLNSAEGKFASSSFELSCFTKQHFDQKEILCLSFTNRFH